MNRHFIHICVGVICIVSLLFIYAKTASAQKSVSQNIKKVTASELPELTLGRSAQFDYDPPAAGSYYLPILKQAGEGKVLGSNGKLNKLSEMLTGKITVLSFIYTRCADPLACPLATRVLYQLHEISEKDPVIAKNLHLISISFDPNYDTPEVMKAFGKVYKQVKKGAAWSMLTTRSEEELRPILDAYGQPIDRKKNANNVYGPIYHQLRVFLIDRKRMIRNIYSYGFLDPRLVMTDIRTLLLEEQVQVEER